MKNPPPVTAAERVAADSLCLMVEEAGNILWARVQGYPWWPAERMPLDAAHQHPALGNAARKKGQDTPVMFFGAAEVAWVTPAEQHEWRSGIKKRFHLNSRLQKRFADALLQLVQLLELRYTPPGWFRSTGVVAPPPPPPAARAPTAHAPKPAKRPAPDSTHAAPAPKRAAVGPAVQPPPYVHLKRLLYTTPAMRPKKPRKEDVQVCACRPPPLAQPPEGRRAAGSASPSIACGRYCLNRHMHVLCDVKRCPAGDACTNKPFHLQPTPALEVFATQHCGLGLRACQDIPRGAFVAEYLGEVIDTAEYRRRLAAAKEAGERDFYMMALGPGRIIDAARKGNLVRFINSSCEPNCEAQKWTDAATGGVHVGLFAKEAIPAGVEVTYDYRFEHAGLGELAEAFRCMCGSDGCRGTLDTAPQRLRDWGRLVDVDVGGGVWKRGAVWRFSGAQRLHTIKFLDGRSTRLVLEEGRFRWVEEGEPAAEGKAAAEGEPAVDAKAAAEGEPAVEGKAAAEGEPAVEGKAAAEGEPEGKPAAMQQQCDESRQELSPGTVDDALPLLGIKGALLDVKAEFDQDVINMLDVKADIAASQDVKVDGLALPVPDGPPVLLGPPTQPPISAAIIMASPGGPGSMDADIVADVLTFPEVIKDIVADVIASPVVEAPTPQRDAVLEHISPQHMSPLPLQHTPMGLSQPGGDLLGWLPVSPLWGLAGGDAPVLLSPPKQL